MPTVSRPEVEQARSALINAAYAQNSANGFSGDPDNSKEPLLNTQSF